MHRNAKSTPPLSTSTHHQSGFSLLELAIALTVIALITGGLLKGRSLIQTAEVQSTALQLQSLETAVAAFQNRYGELPGDFKAASAAGLGNPGNGNGLIDSEAERGQVWLHLWKAGFVKGNFDGLSYVTLQCPASTCATSALGGTLGVSSDYSLTGAGTARLAAMPGNGLSTGELAELDRKIDDGKGDSGQLRVFEDDRENCLDEAGFWMEDLDSRCFAAYLLD